MNWILRSGLVSGALVAAFLLGRMTVGTPAAPELLLDPEVLSEALGDRDWVNRTYQFSALLQQLNPDNLESALETIENSSADLTHDEMRILMHSWARFDPEGAFEYAIFAPEKGRRRMASAVIYAWAGRDPLGARGALLGIQNSDLGRLLEERFLLGWINGGGLAEAHEYVEDLPPSKRRELLVGQIAQVLARESAEAVIAWAEDVDLDEERFKWTVFNKASGALAQYHRQEALAWVVSHYGEHYAEGGAKLVALNWAESDPDAAFEWLSTLPAGEEKSEAVGFIFAYWLKTHPREAAEWLEAADPSESLDPAIKAMAHSEMDRDPPTAIEWARRIHDPGTRERALVRIGQSWYRADPAAARRWLSVSGLPKAGQKSILGAVRPTP